MAGSWACRQPPPPSAPAPLHPIAFLALVSLMAGLIGAGLTYLFVEPVTVTRYLTIFESMGPGQSWNWAEEEPQCPAGKRLLHDVCVCAESCNSLRKAEI